MTRFHHDFETFSRYDLKGGGSSRYARDVSTEALMLAYAFDDGPVRQWVPAEGEPMPSEVRDAMTDPHVTKFAWNKPFEWNIWTHTLGIETPHEVWIDPMVVAMSISLPGKLEQAGVVLGLPADKLKDRRGSALISKFCKPRKPTKKLLHTRNMPEHHPWDWMDFLTYNRQDVEAERAVWKKIAKWNLTGDERAMWVLDQEINAAGYPINQKMVKNAIRLRDELVASRLDEMREITGLDNPNSPKQLLPWLQERGYPFDDLKKGHVERALTRALKEVEDGLIGDNFADEHDRYIAALELRQETSKTSLSKYDALDRATDEDGNLRFTFQFAGAQRTARWAGRIFQPQNVAKPDKALENMVATVARHIEKLDAASFEMIYEKPMDALVTGLRPTVKAPDGWIFVDVDLSAIENIVLGYMSGERKILSVFEDGRDPYLDFAQYLFNMPYDDLVAEFEAGKKGKRTLSKPGVLGCLGADTPVLTKRGWTRIVDVRDDDEIHDGTDWTGHGGVAYRGDKNLLSGSGIHATYDHKIKVGKGWVPWQQAKEQPMFGKALATANGAFSNMPGHPAAPGRNFFVDAAAGKSASYRGQTSQGAYLPGVEDALLRTVAATSASASGLTCSTFSRIVSTLRDRGARTPKITLTSITAGEEFVCGSVPPNRGWAIASMLSARTGRSKSTEKTTMEITSREICGSLRDPSKTRTKGPSWDIVNAGTRQSFVVLTESGPVVAHNCGYMLSAGQEFENEQTGEIEATGLLGYAWNMGVRDFTMADSKHSVATWRETFAQAVLYWRTIERAAKQCVLTGKITEAGPVRFKMEPPLLKMVLPSGRELSYVRPKIRPVKTPWGAIKDTLIYEGQNEKKMWGRITTHPGKLTENADQAIARDILRDGMLRARGENLDIRLHVHDQVLCMVREANADRDLEILKQCLTEPPSWAPDIPLNAGGFKSQIFTKD